MRTDVARWLHRRTFRALDHDPRRLLEHECRQQLQVSLVLPALDQQRTVGVIVAALRRDVVDVVPMVDAHLSGFVQPLSGEYAGRRELLDQVDLGTRRHGHQSDAGLGRMAGQVLQAALARCPGVGVPVDTLEQYVRTGTAIEAVTWEVGVTERPPMRTMPGYRGARVEGPVR